MGIIEIDDGNFEDKALRSSSPAAATHVADAVDEDHGLRAQHQYSGQGKQSNRRDFEGSCHTGQVRLKYRQFFP